MKYVPAALFLGCLFDLWTNLELDFSDYKPFIVLTMRVLVAFMNFAFLLMILFNTYPVQVGLFDIVTKQARPVLAIHIIHIVVTIWFSGAYVDHSGLTQGVMMDIWLSEKSVRHGVLMLVHNLVAVVYYLVTYRSCVEFLSPIYTDKAAWVIIAQDRYNLHPVPISSLV
mmetsp:Transcript_58582/g.132616  ORF Transcript_58582/g.132616 Transcript_58582/m.132616 type:complete len:169 (+) Transcript_58582:211-717(+)